MPAHKAGEFVTVARAVKLPVVLGVHVKVKTGPAPAWVWLKSIPPVDFVMTSWQLTIVSGPL